MTSRFAGSSAVVTGAASGLGEAIARHLAAQDIHVVAVDRDEQRGSVVASQIGGTFAAADVTDADLVIAAIESAQERAPLRVAVNCAGILGGSRTIGRDGQFASAHDLDMFRRIIDVNLVGTFNVTRLAATAMSRNEPFDEMGERGVIVNTTSIAAYDGQIGQVAYSASKAGIAGATLPLARDLAVVGIRVNAIAPGLIETPIYGTGPEAEEFKAKLGRDVLFPKRLGTSAEIASMAWELVNNAYLNGEVVRVDAGIRLPPK